MKIDQRINAFLALGERISRMDEETITKVVNRTGSYNNWFTDENVRLALSGIQKMLTNPRLSEWVNQYQPISEEIKRVGIVAAGNIPAVGFHDFLCVLISGHQVFMKLSHQDPFLIPYLAKILIEIEPGFSEEIHFPEQLKTIDAIIATGSDNSARYFEYYFSKYPNIIRKNRTSVAVIQSDDTDNSLKLLGKDVFQYYGLGCRNVSKIFIPTDFDLKRIIENFESYEKVIDHHKYRNNYDYNKSIYLVNKTPHLDNGFTLFRETDDLVSPISVLYYQYYKDLSELKASLEMSKIQCIVSNDVDISKDHSVGFGMSQEPDVDNYADNVDTMQFLTSL